MKEEYQNEAGLRQSSNEGATSGDAASVAADGAESAALADTPKVEVPPGLQRGLGKIYGLLRASTPGTLVTRECVLEATGWKPTTLTTYERKNKLSHFLARRGDSFEVLRGGANLKPADIVNALSQVTQDALPLHQGEKLAGTMGEYQLERELGRGAVGHVWLASRDGDSFALKIVNPRADLVAPHVIDDVMRRFGREAKNGAKLRSDALVKHVDAGTHRHHPFLVMELAGASVKELLAKNGPLTVFRSAEAILRCVEALQVLHALGCVHRDVKPSNILECGRGFVLADLGIVRWSDLHDAFTSAGTITRGAVQLGSWHYMAPEQLDQPHLVGPASDVYALGVTWYEMLTGATPSPHALAAKKCAAPSTLVELNEIITTMTDFDPAARPTLAEVARVARTLVAS